MFQDYISWFRSLGFESVTKPGRYQKSVGKCPIRSVGAYRFCRSVLSVGRILRYTSRSPDRKRHRSVTYSRSASLVSCSVRTSVGLVGLSVVFLVPGRSQYGRIVSDRKMTSLSQGVGRICE